MTVSMDEHPYRELNGKAFVTLRPIAARIDDDRFPLVFDYGGLVVLHGGCEVDIDDYRLGRALEDIEECGDDWADAMERRPDLFSTELLIPLIVNDPAWPKDFAVLVALSDMRDACNLIELGKGPNVNRTLNCVHDFMVTGCLSCQKMAWEGRLAKLREADNVKDKDKKGEGQSDQETAGGDARGDAAKGEAKEAYRSVEGEAGMQGMQRRGNRWIQGG